MHYISNMFLVLPLTLFQDSGQHLSVIDDCNDHMLTVWDWQKKSKIAEIKVIENLISVCNVLTTNKMKMVSLRALQKSGCIISIALWCFRHKYMR